MSDGIDDFPEHLLPRNEGKKIKAFTFGGDDEDEDDMDEAPEPSGLTQDEDPEPEPEQDEPTNSLQPEQPAEPSEAVKEMMGEIDLDTITKAASHALEDPSVAALSKITQERFYRERPIADENARVTRGWLCTLSQRDFFLAIGYPGFVLHRLLEGKYSLAQIRNWVDGVQVIQPELRRILMLEHLLERRTQSSRDKMPKRDQIELAMSRMPALAAVSAVVGGFEQIQQAEEQQLSRGTQVSSTAPEAISEIIRVVKPGERTKGTRRPGSNLPLSKRSQGKGRPLGGILLKPDSYCYTISKRSLNKNTGLPRITPQEVMDLVNKSAELESRYRTYYSLRRRDTNLPWCAENIELLPTEELERQRTQAVVDRREAEENGL